MVSGFNIFAKGTDNHITVNDDKSGHIYRDANGHMSTDTPHNRRLLESVSNNDFKLSGYR